MNSHPNHSELSTILAQTAALLRQNYANLYPGMGRWELWLYRQTARHLETLARRLGHTS